MPTHFAYVPDPETGINFVHTSFTDAQDMVVTDRPTIMLDQMANAAACRGEASWLKAVMQLGLHETDPTVADALQTASERGAGSDRLPYHIRKVYKDDVYRYINILTARAARLDEWADGNHSDRQTLNLRTS